MRRRFLQHETQHVGRVVVLQILTIERMNGGIINDRDTDLAGSGSVIVQNRVHSRPQSARIDQQRRLLIGELNLHHIFGSLPRYNQGPTWIMLSADRDISRGHDRPP